MEFNISTVSVWSYGLAGIGYLALVLYLLAFARDFVRHAGRFGLAMLIALGLNSLWGWSGFLFSLTAQPAFLHLHLLLDTLRYGAWYACLLVLLNIGTEAGIVQPLRRKRLIGVAVVIVIIGVASQGFLLWFSGTFSVARLAQFNALAMVIYALSLVEQLLRNAEEDSRWNIKPLGLSLACVFIFDLYLYSDALLFQRIGGDAFGVRGFVYALIIPLLAQSIARTRQRTLRLVLSQTAAFHTTTLVMVGVYLLVASAAGYYVRYFGGNWGRALQITLLFAALLALLVLAFSGSMRAKLRVYIGKHFFRYRYDYREEWLKFTKALSAEGASHEVGQRLIRGLADLVESPAGALWLKDDAGQRYEQSARWNTPDVTVGEDVDSSLVRFLLDSGWVMNLEEYRLKPDRYEGVSLPEWLTGLPNAWLVVPLVTANKMVGFVVLTTARTTLDMNWEVNDLLKTVGRQAASFIAQMQATEALLEARKFDSFNRMSAFVVHDLKNIVTQLSLMIKNAERHRDNPEFQRDMLSTVQNSVERMRQLMLQLREGATPVGVVCGVDLAAIVHRIKIAKAGQLPELDLHVEESVIARGHEERIERVIGHMVQNALDATDSSGIVEVIVGRLDGMALVEVSDTGGGMSPEFVRERLFKPFQTTKQAGMGIGAYESFQYVQELGGKIQVDSTPNVGTRVKMLLPLFNIPRGSDLHRLELA
ncbi:MAG TPA: XrtA/PEP-CTERM system histidine kinase PrsK [Gallionella sp.]